MQAIEGRARIRRARCLAAFWEDGEFILENYLTHKRTAVAPQVIRLLHELEG